jgi:CRAL/TRIO domain
MQVSHRHECATNPLLPHQQGLVLPPTLLVEWSMLSLITMLPVLYYAFGGLEGGGDGVTSAMLVAVMALSMELLYLLQAAHTREKESESTGCPERPPSQHQQRQQQQQQRPQDSEDQSDASVRDDTSESSDNNGQQQQQQYQDNLPSVTPDASTPLTTSGIEEGRKIRVATYSHGCIVYPDGSPAHVPAGESPTNLPRNFVDFRQGNHQAALVQWQTSQQWRRDRNVYKIHSRPDPCFRAIKEAYPHICHGKSKQGWAVMYEFPGRMDLKRMFHSDISNDDILHHDVFVLEYVANVLHPKIMMATSSSQQGGTDNSWGMIGILDLKGATLGDFFSRDVIHYLTMIAKVSDDHYPLHVKKLFMINAPFWMSRFFNVIKPILPKTLVIEVLSGKDYDKVLREYIDDAELAQEFGGSSPYKLGEHPYELELVKLATQGVDPDNGGAPVDVVVDIQPASKEHELDLVKLATKGPVDVFDIQQASSKQELPQPEDLSRDDATNVNITVKGTSTDAPRQLLREERLCWPVKLPSLCSTVLSSSSGDDENGLTNAVVI